MHILYVASKHDYGNPARGLSFEHHNFYDTLVHMGHDITYFDFMTECQQRGKAAMNARLCSLVKAERPALLFCVLYEDELDIDVMREISQHTDTVTYNWFCDDHWRFDNYSRHWAPAFNWVSTTAASALSKYQGIGYKNVIKTQWACNHFLYQPIGTQPDYDVTFIGQPHGNRRQIIAALRAAGVDVKTWGYGWDTGRLTQHEMIDVFSRSRINLNLSNASTTGVGGLKRFLPWNMRLSQQIKGRNFEIPGCAGFLLTGMAENLDSYYTPDLEVSVFAGVNDLIRKVQFYLGHEAERQRVAQAGYARTIKEHTYEQRLNHIFATIGLIPPPRRAGLSS